MRKKGTTMKRRIIAGLVLALAFTAAARADDPPAVLAADPADRDTLRATIEAAKTEGLVSYWDAVIAPETNDEMVPLFLKAYGLPASFAVKHTLSPTLGVVTRVEQEVNSGNVTIDLASLASAPWVSGLVKAGHVLKYDSPEAKHYDKAYAAGLGLRGYFTPNGAYMFVPAWNPDTLDFKGKSWKDVLNAVPAGRISINDSPNSATGLLSYMGIRQILDLDYFKALAKMKPQFIVRSEQTAERLVNGQDLMAWGGSPGRILQYNERGANLKFMLPEEGVLLLGNATFILAKAPHPNAAKLWLDFQLTVAGQTILSKKEALVSTRTGFTSPLPEYAPAIDSLKLIPMDWSKIGPDEIKKGKAEWQSIFTP
jgi:iron(III) transport system substrate-binding protein